jgi:pantothenate kinase
MDLFKCLGKIKINKTGWWESIDTVLTDGFLCESKMIKKRKKRKSKLFYSQGEK